MSTRLEIGRAFSSRLILAALIFFSVSSLILLPVVQAQEFDPVKAALDEVDQLNIVQRAEAEDAATPPDQPAVVPATQSDDLRAVLQDPLPPGDPGSFNFSSGTSALPDGRSSANVPASGGGTVDIQDPPTRQTGMIQDSITPEFQFPTRIEDDETSNKSIGDGTRKFDRLLLAKRDAIAEKAVSAWTLQDFTAIKDRVIESK